MPKTSSVLFSLTGLRREAIKNTPAVLSEFRLFHRFRKLVPFFDLSYKSAMGQPIKISQSDLMFLVFFTKCNSALRHKSPTGLLVNGTRRSSF